MKDIPFFREQVASPAQSADSSTVNTVDRLYRPGRVTLAHRERQCRTIPGKLRGGRSRNPACAAAAARAHPPASIWGPPYKQRTRAQVHRLQRRRGRPRRLYGLGVFFEGDPHQRHRGHDAGRAYASAPNRAMVYIRAEYPFAIVRLKQPSSRPGSGPAG
jgi:hypothetical protein